MPAIETSPSAAPAGLAPEKSGPGPGTATGGTDPGGPGLEVLRKARRGSSERKARGPGPRAGRGEDTLIYDKTGRAQVAGAPRLLFTAGPRKGAEHPLLDERTTIGRGEGNVLVVPDLSVSRQHSRVEREEEGWVVVDQGSGNGTRVNGEEVARHPLQHGDEIEMGDTRLQFVEPGGVLVKGALPVRPSAPGAPEVARDGKGARAKHALRRRAPLQGAVLVALAAVLLLAHWRRQRELRRAAEEAAQGDESRAFARKRFQEGILLLKSGKWMEARDKFKIAAVLDPQDAGIARSLESAQIEAPRAQDLAAARAALSSKDYQGAQRALLLIPDDSALAEDAHQLRQQVSGALESAVREARSRAEAGDMAGAEELLDPVLLAEPARSDALAVQAAMARQRRPRAVRRREPARPAAAAPPALPAEVQGIVEAYLAGDLAAAEGRARVAESAPGRRLLTQLETFEAARREGFAARQAGRALEALRALARASEADRNIAQGQEGRLGREVHKALSVLHERFGEAQAGSDESLPQAAAHLRAAVENDPANGAAQAQLAQIVERAREIYLRGYLDKDLDSEAARKSFQLVVETLPASDETAQKAKRWLDRLDGPAAADPE